MREIKGQVVICIDEIDTTLSLNFTNDFYAAIRYLHNARGHVPEFKRLSFVLIGVATPGDLMRDPYNARHSTSATGDLTDFNAKEALPLLAGLGLEPAHAREVLGWILDWTGGHPYLTLRLCRTVAQAGRSSWQRSELDELVAKTFFGDQAEKDNNLQFVRDMLTKRAANSTAVLTTYLDILRKPGHVVDEEQSLVKSHLKLSGVVQRNSGGVLSVRNKIYRKVFDERWVKNHLPETLKKRLRRTAIVSGATTMFALVGILLIPLTIYAWYQKSNAEQAYEKERLARAEAVEQRRITQQALAEAHLLRREAEDQKARAEEALTTAQLLREEAEEQKTRAEDAAKSESEARHQAEAGKEEAQKQKEQAEKQREIAVAAGVLERSARSEAEALRTEAQRQEKLAKDAEKLSKGGQLGALAELTRNQQARLLKRSVLLAQESMIINPTEVGYQALSRGVALLPEPVATLPHAERVQSVTFGKDRDTLIVLEGNVLDATSTAQTVEVHLWKDPFKDNSGRMIFNQETVGDAIIQRPDNISVSALMPTSKSSLSPRGKYLAQRVNANQPTQETWELVELETGTKRPLQGATLSTPIFSPDDRYIATLNSDNTVSISETESLRAVSRLPNPSRPNSPPITSPSFVENPLVFSATGARVALTVTEAGRTTGLERRIARIYESTTGKLLANLPTDPGVAVLFSPDAAGKYLATINNSPDTGESYVAVWDVALQKSVVRLFPSKRINRVVFSPDGKHIAVASDDFTARVWDIGTWA